ncbi:TetR/AcrR family transcriptional regulator [Actinocrinis sp.]|uniref:TetR/AcrR family transcriptional regulator n=1 Tax=Actinocrinis sp. TaxID=1920516 RepID=UPI002D53A70A|nr:TetR/AcrR family transcriptional regulator [Actinocrinis sp.]HZP54031.1 TetR/AcrR family transcriptional regulator [Actinocrinis sp.]
MAGRPAGHQALLDAASAEFAGRGYYATSIRDIAARAGVSLSALYHYYPGKQALLAALLHEGMDAYFALCDDAMAQAGRDPAGRLAAVVGATVRYRAERSVASLILINEARALPEDLAAAYRERERQATDLFRSAINAGIASGVFTTPYPDDARRTIIAACNAVAQWYRPDGPVPLDVLAERYVTLAYTLLGYRRRTPLARSRAAASAATRAAAIDAGAG